MKFKCPVCRTRTVWEDNPYRPFCSERCKLADLGAWASGEYIIAGTIDDVSGSESSECESHSIGGGDITE